MPTNSLRHTRKLLGRGLNRLTAITVRHSPQIRDVGIPCYTPATCSYPTASQHVKLSQEKKQLRQLFTNDHESPTETKISKSPAMRSLYNWGALVLLLLTSLSSCTSTAGSKLLLPADFTPPQVFKHSNLLRTIDLTRPYARETIAAVVENVSKVPQSEYYLPVSKETLPKVSYVEAKDKKSTGDVFVVTLVEFSEERYILDPRIRNREMGENNCTNN